MLGAPFRGRNAVRTIDNMNNADLAHDLLTPSQPEHISNVLRRVVADLHKQAPANDVKAPEPPVRERVTMRWIAACFQAVVETPGATVYIQCAVVAMYDGLIHVTFKLMVRIWRKRAPSFA